MQRFSPIDYPVSFSHPRWVAPVAWARHIPFWMSLVSALRPGLIVELGTGTGISYCAFCQAVQELGISTRCHAVDTWQEHAQADALADLRAHHDPLYSSFSQLLESTPDDALSSFADNSIDLLHIASQPAYGALKHDFEKWRGKLNNRGVVVFRGTQIEEGSSGVRRLWLEVRDQYPSFEITHAEGVGILQVGPEIPAALEPLFTLPVEELDHTRQVFHYLGSALLEEAAAREPGPSVKISRAAPTPARRETPAVSSAEAGGSAPTVSVIIPNYNGRAYIGLCLKSLEKLDFPREQLEVLVVDNASDDDSVALIEESFPRVRLVCNETNLGFSEAANQAAGLARGKYLAFLNSDMRVDKNWLTALLDAIHGEPEIACAGSMILNWEGTEVQFFGRPEDFFAYAAPTYGSRSQEERKGVRYSLFASGGAMLIASDLFRDFGGFDDGYFMYHEDVDLGWRLWLQGYKCVLTPSSVVFHKGGASSFKLSPLLIQTVKQRNTLVTLYRNLDDESLGTILPFALYYILVQDRADFPGHASPPVAIADFRASLVMLAQQRQKIQQGRRRSDREIFAHVGQPFRALTSNPAMEAIQIELMDYYRPGQFDAGDAQSMDRAIAHWLTAAHFLKERFLLAEVARDRYAEQLEELKVIKASRAWRVAQQLQRMRAILVPHGSRRAQLARKVLDTIRGGRPDFSALKQTRLGRALAAMLKRRRLAALAAQTAHAFAQPSLASPTVSIIIPVHNQVEYTLGCLLSIHAIQPKATYEIIVLDDDSTDETRRFLEAVPGVRYIRNTENLGFLRSCNRAAREAAGTYLLFLNNDTRVHPGWLDHLLETFSLIPGTGLAGSKLILRDGRLQEAGGVIWADGSAANCGRLADPRDFRYNYLREVDYVSGASILIPRQLWEQLEGFDERYQPAYYEDVDLAFRVRRAGYKVVYQPFSELTHIEGGSNGTDLDTGVKRYQVVNQQKFREAWQLVIASHGPRQEDVGAHPQGRYSGRRVLYIDDGTPKPDHYAGGVLTEFYISTLIEAGYAVTFLPHLDIRHAGAYTEALQKKGVECVYSPYVATSRDYIVENGRDFDYVVISRANVGCELIETVKRFAPRAKVAFSTIDLHYLRLERAARVSGKEKDVQLAQQARRDELGVVARSDCTLVVSDVEATLLTEALPDAKIRVVPFPADIYPLRDGFDARQDIVFIGGFGHVPNVDAVLFFAEEVWPTLARELPEARFVIAGAEATPRIEQLHGDRLIVRGYVEDLDSLFATAKLSVAPIRFGAGLKGKILTSLGYGVPCVASSIAAEGTGLTHLENVLVADDAEEIARQVRNLYTSPELWIGLSQRGQDWIRENYSRPVVASKLLQAFRGLD